MAWRPRGTPAGFEGPNPPSFSLDHRVPEARAWLIRDDIHHNRRARESVITRSAMVLWRGTVAAISSGKPLIAWTTTMTTQTIPSTIPAPAALERPRPEASKAFWTTRRIIAAVFALTALSFLAAGLAPTRRWAPAAGYIMTSIDAELRPSVEGAIAEWLVRSGERVEQGQAVIRLHDAMHRAAYERALADLKAKNTHLGQLLAKQSLDEAQAAEELALARRRLSLALSRQELDSAQRREQVIQSQRSLSLALSQWQRMDRANESAGVFSPKEIEDARLRVELAQSRLTELEISHDAVDAGELEVLDGQIQAAQKHLEARRADVALQLQVLRGQIETGEKNLALCAAELAMRTITAPIAGTVYFNRYEVGEVVKPDHVLGQVFDTSDWIVKLKVPERQASRIRHGQPVEVTLAAYPWYRYGHLIGEVARIRPVVIPLSGGSGAGGAFYVDAKINDPDQFALQPGMNARVRIDTGATNWFGRLAGW